MTNGGAAADLQAEPAAGRAARPAARARAAGSKWQSALFWPLLAVVVLAPLPLGSNRPLPAALLATVVGALLLAWGVGLLFGAIRPTVSVRPIWPALVLFALAASWAAVQALPVTPASLHHPYWAEARAALDPPPAGAISVDPHATWTRLAGLLAYGGIFWLAFQLCRPTERARRVVLGLAAAGLLYALYGLYVHFSGSAGVPWLDRGAYHGVVTSTFVNRNSYATYAGITLLCGLGVVVQAVARRAKGGRPLARVLARTLARLDGTTGTALLAVLFGATALLLTQSRGAFVALVPAVVAFLWLTRRLAVITSRQFYWTMAALAVVFFLGVLWLSGERTLERFEQAGPHLATRLTYYETTWQAIRDRPLLGTGYGTYADAFKAYNHPGTGAAFVNRAHNTYLQLAMELGWPAAAALVLGVGWLAARCRPRPGAGRASTAYLAVVVSCSVLVGVHALVDFSLEMPAIAATYALLLGLGCAQAQGRNGAD